MENNIQKSEENKEDKKDDEVEEKTIQSFSGLAPQFVEIQQPTKKAESKSKGKD
ncbi:hypothetical protein J6T66_05890 [bacterium]|nr:hypothetical protein [bacterium]